MGGKTLNLSFIVNTWEKDSSLASELLLQMRKFYPDAQILVSSDGPATPELQQSCIDTGATLTEGERLKNQPSSNAWTIRMFQLMSQLDSEYVIKIDPDCRLNRKLTFPDEAFNIAAKLLGGVKFIGPCIIFSKGTISKIQSSGLLQSLPAQSYRFSRGEPLKDLHTQDDLLRRIIPKLGLKTVDLPDANIAWASPPIEQDGSAICHPRLDSLPLIGQRCRWPDGDDKTIEYSEKLAQQILEDNKNGINL
jgi:hypothetical protein